MTVSQCLVPLIAIALLGCGPRLNLAGSYIGHRPVDAVPGADPAIIEGISKVELKVEEDGRFVLFESGIPKTGAISVDGNTVTLTITEVGGRRGDATPKTVSKEEGKLVYRDPDKPGEEVSLEPKT